MSKQVEELLRKAVELARRAGAVMPSVEPEAAELEVQNDYAARIARTGGTDTQRGRTAP